MCLPIPATLENDQVTVIKLGLPYKQFMSIYWSTLYKQGSYYTCLSNKGEFHFSFITEFCVFGFVYYLASHIG